MGSSTFRKRDLARYVKVYPFVRRTPVWGYTSDKAAIIESARVLFDNQSSATYKFQEHLYLSIPTVSATPVTTNKTIGGQADVNVYITAVSTTEVTFETSEKFTGEIHLQIMYVEES